MKIETDATISDVLPKLKKPEAYVSGVLQKLYECRRANEGCHAVVRIGVAGQGVMPYYRILARAEAGKADRRENIFGAFHDNHTPLESPASEATDGNWSSRFSTLEEIKQLLGVVRQGIVRKR